MPLNTSGPISLGGATVGQSINIELGQPATATTSLNATNVRTLAGVPSGAIIMPTNFYGKSNRPTLSVTFSANTANATVAINSLPGYVAGSSDITVTINSGIYLFATSTGTSGLTFSGGNSGDTLTIVNNGFIMGQGGIGSGQISSSLSPAGAGGPALSLSYPATINNTNPAAFIAGGGGGGGAGNNVAGGGGGAGGGVGGASPLAPGNGGGGGGIGAAGAPGPGPSAAGRGGGAGGGGGGIDSGRKGALNPYGGGGGGRILPGVGGAGGVGTASQNGGAGGSANAAGSPGTGPSAPTRGGGGGGGWGASGAPSVNSGGAGGGRAVTLNGRTVTWVAGDTSRVYGAVS